MLYGEAVAYAPPRHIALVNKAPGQLDDLEAALWVEAYREQLKRVADAWGLPAPGLALYPAAHTEDEPAPDVAVIYAVASAGDPDALGYHTAAGRSRWGYVDLTLSWLYDRPSIVFGHELFELFVDADCDRWSYPLPDGSRVALEVGDPVQRDSFGVTATFFGTSRTVQITDWVLPSWFEIGAPGPYSWCKSTRKPLTDAPGGYHLTERNGVIVTGDARVKSFGRTLRRLVGK
jgi:hypothetical protein